MRHLGLLTHSSEIGCCDKSMKLSVNMCFFVKPFALALAKMLLPYPVAWLDGGSPSMLACKKTGSGSQKCPGYLEQRARIARTIEFLQIDDCNLVQMLKMPMVVLR
jgi:hypothetical protein